MPKISIAIAVIAALAAGAAAPTAFAADISADSLKLAPGVVKAAGYEASATTYIVANSTNIYSDHALVDTKVTGELKRGDRVEVLAKVAHSDDRDHPFRRIATTCSDRSRPVWRGC
jgi:hypothetical protein